MAFHCLFVLVTFSGSFNLLSFSKKRKVVFKILSKRFLFSRQLQQVVDSALQC